MSNEYILSENAKVVLDFLLELPHNESVYSAHISQELFLPPRTVIGVLNGLVKKGLVIKDLSPDPSVTQKVYKAAR